MDYKIGQLREFAILAKPNVDFNTSYTFSTMNCNRSVNHIFHRSKGRSIFASN